MTSTYKQILAHMLRGTDLHLERALDLERMSIRRHGFIIDTSAYCWWTDGPGHSKKGSLDEVATAVETFCNGRKEEAPG